MNGPERILMGEKANKFSIEIRLVDSTRTCTYVTTCTYILESNTQTTFSVYRYNFGRHLAMNVDTNFWAVIYTLHKVFCPPCA